MSSTRVAVPGLLVATVLLLLLQSQAANDKS